MSFEFIKKLPTPAEIRKELPLPAELVKIKEERDAEIRDVLTGKSNKFLVIIGPCSADNEDSVCDYVNRLARVNEQVKDKLILNPALPVKATKVSLASPIPRRSLIFWQD